jgi:hypothetical protein
VSAVDDLDGDEISLDAFYEVSGVEEFIFEVLTRGAPVGGEEQKQWPPGSAGLCETGVDGAEPYAGRIGGKA